LESQKQKGDIEGSWSRVLIDKAPKRHPQLGGIPLLNPDLQQTNDN
jgi:hypothetical protein